MSNKYNNYNKNYFDIPSSCSLSGSFSADNLIQPLFGMPFSCMQQNIEQQVISPYRVFHRRSIGGNSSLFSGIIMSFNGILDSYCSCFVIEYLFSLFDMLCL